MLHKKNYHFILLLIICGAIISSAFGLIISFILPDGVVKEFFLLSKMIGWDPLIIDLFIINLNFGMYINISVLSIIGMFVSWYFLRYFK